MNKLDEAFGFICIHIFRELLFHLDGMKTPKEVWEKLESLFGKQDEPRSHITENEIIALQTNNFETIQQIFSKFKSIFMQCKQCVINKNDEQLVLLILSKLGVIADFTTQG